jgi:hypothetical protein
MSTIMPHRCPCGCGKFDHNAFRPVANCAFNPPPRPTGSRRAQTPPSADTLAAHRDLDDSPMVTISQFQALARTRGWSEDWLVEQCRDGMDNPRQIHQRNPGRTRPNEALVHERDVKAEPSQYGGHRASLDPAA